MSPDTIQRIIRRFPSPALGRNQSQLTQRHEATKERSYPGILHFVILVALCENNSLRSRGLCEPSEMIWKWSSVVVSWQYRFSEYKSVQIGVICESVISFFRLLSTETRWRNAHPTCSFANARHLAKDFPAATQGFAGQKTQSPLSAQGWGSPWASVPNWPPSSWRFVPQL